MVYCGYKKSFFLGFLGVFLSQEISASPYKNKGSIYGINPQWQEFHTLPPRKNQKTSLSPQFFKDPTMLSLQRNTLKSQVNKSYEQLHQSGIMTGLYRRQLEKEYSEKKEKLQRIDDFFHSQKRDWGSSFRPMNPLNSITRFLVVNTDQRNSGLLYKKHR